MNSGDGFLLPGFLAKEVFGMVCKLKKESQKLRTAYWTLVGAASAMLITVQPVMADTLSLIHI